MHEEIQRRPEQPRPKEPDSLEEPDDATSSDFIPSFDTLARPREVEAKPPGGTRSPFGDEHLPQRPRDATPTLPANPLELPTLRDDTFYACITSTALRTRAAKERYTVPAGYVGLAVDAEGETRAFLHSGEEVSGEFVLHLFREGTIIVPQLLARMVSADGFEIQADLKYSVRLAGVSDDALRDFLVVHADGRSHLSLPVFKSRFERVLHETLAAHALEHPVGVLLDKPKRPQAELSLLERLKQRMVWGGVRFLGLDSLRFVSPDYDKARRKEAERRRDLETRREEREIEKVIMREETGSALSRAELSEVLGAIEHKQNLQKIENHRERLERESALSRLEHEYRAEHCNLEAALTKMVAANDLEIDRIRFEEYLRMTATVRERLKEDRVEFYINQIRDEKLKAELLRRLIERDMSPDQLRELAALERVRSERLRSIGAQAVATPEPSATEERRGEPSEDNSRLRENGVESVPAVAPAEHERAATLSDIDNDSPEAARADSSESDADDETAILNKWAGEVAVLDDLPATPRETRSAPQAALSTLYIVAGRCIYAAYLDGAGRGSELHLYADLGEYPLGSLRSLRFAELNGERVLLVGARRGVYKLDPSSRRISTFPIDAAFNPVTGVNGCAPFRGALYATHSQFGLLRWSLAFPERNAARYCADYTDQAPSVRSLFIDDGFWPTFTCGARMVALEHHLTPRVAAVYSGAPSSLVAAGSVGPTFFAACEDGSIVSWEKNEPTHCVRRAMTKRPISAATIDGDALVIATRSHYVHTFSPNDNRLSRYEAPQEIRFARRVGAAVFGLSRDRSTLYLWNDRDDSRPVTELPVPDACYDMIAG